MQVSEDDNFFSLLVNISISSESTLERLTNQLKIFVDKFFNEKDFTAPQDPLSVVMNCIMQIEAVLYTIYELEKKLKSEEEKLEVLYYKDIVLKCLVVLTNLDFFVEVLKKNNLYKDADDLREKVELEFRVEAANFQKDIQENNSFLEEKAQINGKFKYIKPSEYRKAKKKINLLPDNIPISGEQKESDVLNDIKNKSFMPLENLKKRVKKKDSNFEPKTDKKGNKIMRTATGWEIPSDFFDNPLYSEQ